MSNFILSLRFLLILFLLFSVKGFSATVTDAGFPSGIRGDGEPSVLSPPQLRSKTSPFVFAVSDSEVQNFPSDEEPSGPEGNGLSPSPEHLKGEFFDEVVSPQTRESVDQPITAITNSGGEAVDTSRTRKKIRTDGPPAGASHTYDLGLIERDLLSGCCPDIETMWRLGEIMISDPSSLSSDVVNYLTSKLRQLTQLRKYITKIESEFVIAEGRRKELANLMELNELVSEGDVTALERLIQYEAPSFSCEAWWLFQKVLGQLRENSLYREAAAAVLDWLGSFPPQHRGKRLALIEFYKTTQDSNFAQALLINFEERSKNTDQEVILRNNEDVDVMYHLLTSENPDTVRRTTIKVAGSVFMFHLPSHRKRAFIENILNRAREGFERDDFLDRVRYAYLDDLTNNLSFCRDDTDILNWLANDPRCTSYWSSLKALIKYEKTKGASYPYKVIQTLSTYHFPKSIRSMRLAITEQYRQYQYKIGELLEQVRDERSINLSELCDFGLYITKIKDREVRKSLIHLYDFLRSWYSHPLTEGVHRVPVPRSLFSVPTKTEASVIRAQD